MNQWLIISGKGGTGKTSVTAAFAVLAGNSVLADCDVDAADLHLLTEPENLESHEFVAGIIPTIDPTKCTGCGICEDLCQFGAIKRISLDKSIVMQVDEVACEGCDVCHYFCPEDAITVQPNHCGSWYVSRTRFGDMVHARLIPGAENSGKLVSLVRKKAEQRADENGCDLVLVDGPPGTGCPVVSSLSGIDLAILVTEPSPSGRHDLLRVLELAEHFNIPSEVIINKWDLNEDYSMKLEQELATNNVSVAGKIRFDPRMYDALLQGKTIVELSDDGAANDMKTIWKKLIFNHRKK
ncbi:ATP-binding protein [bacterium]|nr:ATP-binding protein [bacterium]